MSVLLMLLVLLEIFAHFRDNAKFDSVEDFAVIPLRCLFGTNGGRLLFWLRTPRKSARGLTDYAFCDGYSAFPKTKSTGAGQKPLLHQCFTMQ